MSVSIDMFVSEVRACHESRPGHRSRLLCGVPKSEFKKRVEDAGFKLGEVMDAAFPKQDIPCRNFVFGCSEPLTEAQAVDDQLFHLHCYRNSVAAINRSRLYRYRDVMNANPAVKDLREEFAELRDEMRELRDELMLKRVKSRSRRESREDCDRVTEIKKRMGQIIKDRKTIDAEWKKTAECKALLEKMSTELEEEMDSVEERFSGGDESCCSYTRSQIVMAKPENPVQFDGKGRIIRQIRKNDTFLKMIRMIEPEEKVELKKRHRIPAGTTHLLTTLVGNSGKKAMFAVNFHREIELLSETSQITSFSIIRVPTGTVRYVNGWVVRNYRWKIMVCVKDPAGVFFGDNSVTPETGESVAVDVGWRENDDGLKVCTAVGSDGHVHEFSLPPEIAQMAERVKEIDSERDLAMNSMKCAIAECISDGWDDIDADVKGILRAKSDDGDHPSSESAKKSVLMWRSPQKAHRLMAYLINKDELSPTEEFIYQAVSSFCRLGMATGGFGNRLKERVANRRKDFYRRVAKGLRRKYSSVIVEDINTAKIGKVSDVGELDNAGVRKNKTLASIGVFLSAIRMYAVLVNPAFTSKTCSHCGEMTGIGSESRWTCENCGEEFDRDENACVNLLHRAGHARAAVISKISEWKHFGFRSLSPAERNLSQIESEGRVESVF